MPTVALVLEPAGFARVVLERVRLRCGGRDGDVGIAARVPFGLLFREALNCYSGNNFNAFASMCRRASVSAYEALGEGGKLQAFEEVMTAQDIAGIDDESFASIKAVLFDAGEEELLPMLNRVQAGILLEVMKDMLYQCFVRRGKLTRALKVRRFFVQEGNEDLASSA